MADYTPDTDTMRERASRLYLASGLSIEAYDRHHRAEDERRAAFDRWLAAYEAEVRGCIATEILEAAVDDGMSSDWRYGMRVAAGMVRGATR